jgi:hypothetical protein
MTPYRCGIRRAGFKGIEIQPSFMSAFPGS